MREFLEKLLDGRDLAEAEAAALLDGLMRPDASPAMAGALLAALRAKGVVASELRGFAVAMRALARRPEVAPEVAARAIDIVGTGGDASGSLNLSTGTALLVAACGVPVIKHGNRSISSRSGSADVLEQLGLVLPLAEAAAGDCLAESGFTFLFAPHYHPAMKSVAPVRQALGVRTVFNILGPLTNPAAPAFHVLGAYSEAVAELMAGTLAGMPGVRRAFVVHGAAGWDEPTPIGPFTLYDVRNGQVTPGTRTPADFGLPTCDAAALAGADAATNARELRAVLEGGQHGAHRDALLLGAALALECAGEVDGPAAGVARAARAIEDGSTARVLAALRGVGARVAAGRTS